MTMNKTKNEKGQILYGSLVPIFIILAILLGTGYFLLKNEIKMPKFRKEPTEIRRLEGFPTVSEVSSPVEKQKIIIKSQEELNTFLNNADPSGKKGLKEEINFNKEYLIGVSSETNKTFGHELKIKKATLDEEENALTILYIESKPEDACDEDKVPNVTFDIVAISKTDMNISFEKNRVNIKCNNEDQ